MDEALGAVKSAAPDELLRDVMVGVSEQSAHLALWLAKVAEIDRRELWGHVDGARSCAHWLGWRCGLDGRTAREHVRVAHRLEELRAVQRAFAEGRLSYSKVRALTRVATPEAEEFLLDLALTLSAAHLERSLVAYAQAHGEPITLEDETSRRAKCGVTRWVDADGLIHHEIVSAPEDGLVIDRAIDFGRDEVFRAAKEAAGAGDAGGAAEQPRRPAGPAGRLEGLCWALRNGLANAARGLVVDDAYLLVVHVREGQAMVGDDGRVDLGNGLSVHPRVLQRLACDSMIQAMLVGHDGERPLDLGRRRRTATRDQKIALRALHPTCRWPVGCGVPSARCQFHHLEHWSRDLGRSDLDNYLPFCATHHHKVHEGGWSVVVGHDGRLVALSPDGRRHEEGSPLARMRSDAGALVRRVRGHGVEPDGSELAGAYAGEALTAWGVIASGIWDEMHRHGAGHGCAGDCEASVTKAGPVIDPAVARGSPASAN
ncbi:MAG: 13E12 repeat family protein [Actinobacteria bacterium]|nr:13E12 repeat family protein [Actinomycetota bacterium]